MQCKIITVAPWVLYEIFNEYNYDIHFGWVPLIYDSWRFLWSKYMSSQFWSICGRLKFRGVPIFVVFVEGLIHIFQYPWNGNFLYELWTKILWPRILNPTNVLFLFNPWKLVPKEIKSVFILLCQYTCISITVYTL